MKRFTMRKDGIKRCNVSVKLRLTKEEWEAIEAGAKLMKWTPNDLLETDCGLAVEDLVERIKDAVRLGKKDF